MYWITRSTFNIHRQERFFSGILECCMYNKCDFITKGQRESCETSPPIHNKHDLFTFNVSRSNNEPTRCSVAWGHLTDTPKLSSAMTTMALTRAFRKVPLHSTGLHLVIIPACCTRTIYSRPENVNAVHLMYTGKPEALLTLEGMTR